MNAEEKHKRMKTIICYSAAKGENEELGSLPNNLTDGHVAGRSVYRNGALKLGNISLRGLARKVENIATKQHCFQTWTKSHLRLMLPVDVAMNCLNVNAP